MFSRPVRAKLSLLLVFALLTMIGSHATMAMSMSVAGGMAGTTQQVHSSHGGAHMMTDMSSQDVASHSGHHDQQDQSCCGAHCFCSVCHAVVLSGEIFAYNAMVAFTNDPRLLSLAEVSLPLDPRPPPRALSL